MKNVAVALNRNFLRLFQMGPSAIYSEKKNMFVLLKNTTFTNTTTFFTNTTFTNTTTFNKLNIK